MPTPARMTIGASANPAAVGGMRAKNNGRYNGNGRNWGTPPEVFDPLNREFGFTLDPCCSSMATSKCGRFYTERDDGLTKSWAGERVFMNPPYGREIYAWTRKAREEARGGGARCRASSGIVRSGMVARGRGWPRRGPIHPRARAFPDRRSVPRIGILCVGDRHLEASADRPTREVC